MRRRTLEREKIRTEIRQQKKAKEKNIKDVFEENKRKKEKENMKKGLQKLGDSIRFKIRFAFPVLILEISFGESRRLFKTESES